MNIKKILAVTAVSLTLVLTGCNSSSGGKNESDTLTKTAEEGADEAFNELEVRVDEITSDVDAIRDDLDARVEDASSDLDARVEDASTELDAIRAELDARVEDASSELDARVEDASSELDAIRAELDARVEDASSELAVLRADVLARVEVERAELDGRVEDASSELDASVEEFGLDARIETLSAEFDSLVDALSTDFDLLVGELSNDADLLLADISNTSLVVPQGGGEIIGLFVEGNGLFDFQPNSGGDAVKFELRFDAADDNIVESIGFTGMSGIEEECLPLVAWTIADVGIAMNAVAVSPAFFCVTSDTTLTISVINLVDAPDRVEEFAFTQRDSTGTELLKFAVQELFMVGAPDTTVGRAITINETTFGLISAPVR